MNLFDAHFPPQIQVPRPALRALQASALTGQLASHPAQRATQARGVVLGTQLARLALLAPHQQDPRQVVQTARLDHIPQQV